MISKEELPEVLIRNGKDLSIEEMEYSIEMLQKGQKQAIVLFLLGMLWAVIGLVWVLTVPPQVWFHTMGYLWILPSWLFTITFLLPFNFYPFRCSWNGDLTELLWRTRGYDEWMYRSMFRLGNFVVLCGSLSAAPDYDAIKLEKDKHI